VVAVALAVAGCGSAHATRAPLTAAQRAGAQAIARSQAALGRAHSLRIVTVLHPTSGQSTRAVADISLPGRMAVTLTRGGEQSQVRLIGAYAYLDANTAYWRAAGAGAAAASLLVGHWFKLPDVDLSNAGSLVALTRPETLGRCTLGLPGSTATITARRPGTTIVTQRADSTVDRVALGATAPFLPTSDVRTGPNVEDAVCGESAASSAGQITGGTTSFSRYGRAVTIQVPAGAQSEDEMDRRLEAFGSSQSGG
jgi:hypothetical protein